MSEKTIINLKGCTLKSKIKKRNIDLTESYKSIAPKDQIQDLKGRHLRDKPIITV